MRDGYLSTQFSIDLDRLGLKSTRKVAVKQLDALEEALGAVADDASEARLTIKLDLEARAYIRAMYERASGKPLRCPDFEEVVQATTWLADPAQPDTAGDAFDTAGDVSPAGLLCLGEWKSGEIWVLDVAVKGGYVYLVTEKREVVPMFRGIGAFAQWAIANELWKRRIADGVDEVIDRLAELHLFKTMSHLREAGLVPPAFKPVKLFKPMRPVPTAIEAERKLA
jgi:hypothetical protein